MLKKKKTSMIYLEIESEILGDELDVKDEGGGARMTISDLSIRWIAVIFTVMGKVKKGEVKGLVYMLSLR